MRESALIYHPVELPRIFQTEGELEQRKVPCSIFTREFVKYASLR
jgi:hypothetical protein